MIIRNIFSIRLVKQGMRSKRYIYGNTYQRRLTKVDSISNLIKRNII